MSYKVKSRFSDKVSTKIRRDNTKILTNLTVWQKHQSQRRKQRSVLTSTKSLQVNGTFMDVINAAVKHTKANTPKKKAKNG
jgi:hypothetical protein